MTVANWITLLRLIIALTGAFLLGDGESPTGAKVTTALFVLAIALDKLDGMVARRLNCRTTFGEVFDTATDKIIFTVYFLCLLDWKIVDRNLVALAVIRDMLTQAFRSYAVSRSVFVKTYVLSYARYIIQCLAVVSGLLSAGLMRTYQTDLLRQMSVLCFVVGVVLGYVTLWNLVAQHWKEVFGRNKY